MVRLFVVNRGTARRLQGKNLELKYEFPYFLKEHPVVYSSTLVKF